MNKTLKRLVACLTLAVLLASMVYVAPPAQAVNEFYGDYTDAAKVYDYSSCPSMQGLAVGSTYMYTVKIGSNDTSAFISMTHKDTGATTRLYNADAGSYLFNYLGHANDMDVWGIDGYSNLFVTTTNKGSNAIVRLKRNGNNLNKVASYRLVCDGQDICATALAVKGYSNGKITFLTKWGMDLYTGSVDASLSSATIQMTKLCSISKSRVYIKGQYLDLSNFVNQGFGYYKDTLFVPITGDDTQLNRSVIMVFDLRNVATGSTIYPTESLVFRVTSGAYSALFEIESFKNLPELLKSCEKVTFLRENDSVVMKTLKSGLFAKNKSLSIDLAFPIVHGTNCEDGTMAGFFEFLGLPYISCDILSAAVGMDKAIFKDVLKSAGLPVLDCVKFRAREYAKNKTAICEKIINEIGLPIII